jgi:hypothetical protein
VGILFRRSQEEVVRIDTTWVVAGVAYEHTLWYGAVLEYSGDTVCLSRTMDPPSEVSVPILVYISEPYPTSSTFVYIGPKKFLKCVELDNILTVWASYFSSMSYTTTYIVVKQAAKKNNSL